MVSVHDKLPHKETKPRTIRKSLLLISYHIKNLSLVFNSFLFLKILKSEKKNKN